MWLRAVMAALDAGKKPLILDQVSTESKDLGDLAGQVGVQLAALLSNLRRTEVEFLDGFGFLTVEIQNWASLSSFEASGEAGGRALRAMRAYASHALYYGPGSPKLSTGTGPFGSCQN